MDDVIPSRSSTGGLTAVSSSVDRRSLVSEGRRSTFAGDLRVDLRFEDGLWCYECSELHLAGCADSYEAAFERLALELAFLWATSPPRPMTSSTRAAYD